MNKTILQHIAIFSNVRYIKTQIRKRQMQRIHVFMARPVYYFGEDEIFDNLWFFFFFQSFSFSSFVCQR